MQKWICLFSVILLSGCAAFGPNVDDPRLIREEKAAKKALEEAQQWEAPNYHPQAYTAAEDRFQSVQNQHRQNPSESIIGEYRLVQIQANRATIDSLASQLQELKRTVLDKDRRISSLSREIHNQQETIADQESKLEQLRITNENLQDTVAEFRKKIRSLREMSTERQNTIQELRRKVELHSDSVVQLKQTLLTVEDTAAKLRQKLTQREATVTKLREENDSIARQVREQLDEGDVRQENDRVVINLQERILFDLGDARLKPKARETIQRIVSILEQYEKRPIRVEGHTDDLPIKETIKDRFPSNWELSAQRAINVVKYMIHTLNVSSDRIAAVAYGQTRPLVPNTSTANRAKNRRVEIVLLPEDLKDQPSSSFPDGSDTSSE